MDRTVKSTLKNFVWDCTVGTGRDVEDMSEPDDDTMSALERLMGRPLSSDEHAFVCSEWQRCLQEIQSP